MWKGCCAHDFAVRCWRTLPETRGGLLFERFTDRARRAVDLAREEARMLNHTYIGTEHILLGLIHEGEGLAAKALESLGISLQAVRQQVEEIIGQGQHAADGHIPFTPRAKKVFELSLRESLRYGHHIGTEHILLGLIREGDGVAAQVLVKQGADLNRVRQQVRDMLVGPARWTLDDDTIDRLEAWGMSLSADDQVLIREHGAMPGGTSDDHVRNLVARSGFPMRPATNWSDMTPLHVMPDEITEYLADT